MIHSAVVTTICLLCMQMAMKEDAALTCHVMQLSVFNTLRIFSVLKLPQGHLLCSHHHAVVVIVHPGSLTPSNCWHMYEANSLTPMH